MIYYDNKLALSMVKNPINHDKTKHMKIKYCFVCEAKKEKEINLVYCCADNQLANLFTKALLRPRFEF